MNIAIISAQRSGTKFLNTILNSKYNALSLGEVFYPNSPAIHSFTNYISNASYSNSLNLTQDVLLNDYLVKINKLTNRVVIIDIMYNQTDSACLSWRENPGISLYNYIKDNNIFVINLRRSKLDTYLSLLILNNTSTPHHFKVDSHYKLTPIEKITIDANDFIKYCDKIRGYEYEVDNAFSSYSKFNLLNYDQIYKKAFPSELHSSILSFIEEFNFAHSETEFDFPIIKKEINYSEIFENYSSIVDVYKYELDKDKKQSLFASLNQCNDTSIVKYNCDVNLISNIYYGDEIDDLCNSVPQLEINIRKYVDKKYKFKSENLKLINQFFEKKYDNIFGGQITPGDALFIYTFMDVIRPSVMFEFGVASGFSSACILNFANHLNLIQSQSTFLYSFDLDDGSLSGKEVGFIVSKYFSDYMKSWEIFKGKTSIDLINNSSSFNINLNNRKNILCFVDAGHNHPWPSVDIISLYHFFLKNGISCDDHDDINVWIMLQDVRMMERWILDCIKYNVPCPPTIRGVDLAYSFWPGDKISGLGMCFNMCALKLNISQSQLFEYFNKLNDYKYETEFDKNIIFKLFER